MMVKLLTKVFAEKALAKLGAEGANDDVSFDWMPDNSDYEFYLIERDGTRGVAVYDPARNQVVGVRSSDFGIATATQYINWYMKGII